MAGTLIFHQARPPLRVALLLWFILTLTLALQSWVGDRTIYSHALESARSALHQGILENQAPEGRTWAEWGALSVQRRVGVVYLAEGVHRLTAWPIGKVYKAIDTLFLAASMLALFVVLRRKLGETLALVGLLYFCAVLPLTYFFQLFHPWDRVQLFLWIVLLALLEARRLALLSAVLALSVVVKFDTLLLPAMYFAVHAARHSYSRVALEALWLAFIAWACNQALGQLFGDPAEASRFALSGIWAQVDLNVGKMLAMHLRYPPLIVHGLPMVLAAFAWSVLSRVERVAVAFAFALSLVHFLLTNYEEVRAHMMVLVLLLPASLKGLYRLIEPGLLGGSNGVVKPSHQAR